MKLNNVLSNGEFTVWVKFNVPLKMFNSSDLAEESLHRTPTLHFSGHKSLFSKLTGVSWKGTTTLQHTASSSRAN